MPVRKIVLRGGGRATATPAPSALFRRDLVSYIAPFENIMRLLTVSQSPRGGATVAGSYDDLLSALRLLLVSIDVNKDWYLERNPDVAQAIAAGEVESAKQHFVEHGYFEGRLPFPITVDERWYLSQNPDVAENIRNGVEESAQRHFELHGYGEGRLPFLLAGSDCAPPQMPVVQGSPAAALTSPAIAWERPRVGGASSRPARRIVLRE